MGNELRLAAKIIIEFERIGIEIIEHSNLLKKERISKIPKNMKEHIFL
jgi:hypothetical protein